MDFDLLAQLLKELILDNDRVSLPGMGSFIADISPAYFSEDGKTINPPFRRIFFRTNETWNDEIIEKYYADKFRLDINSVRVEMEEFFEKFRLDLNVKKNIDLPGFGKMRSTKEGNIFFVAEKGLDLYADAFGLEPISLKVLTYDASSKIENKEMRGDSLLSEKDATEMHGEQNIEFIIDDETAELIAQDKEEKMKEEAHEEQNEEQCKEQREEPEPFKLDIEPEEAEPAPEIEPEPESDEPEPVPEIEPESEEPEPAPEPAPESAPEPKENPYAYLMVDSGQDTDESDEKIPGKRRGWLIALIIVIAIILILIALMLLFKEQAGDILEKFLYSKEELDLIHKVS